MRIRVLFLLALLAACMPSTASAADQGLAWDAVVAPTLQGYRVYYGLASHAYTIQFEVGLATSIRIPALTAGQTYYFAVTAIDMTGLESAFSNEVGVLIADTPPTVRNFVGMLSGTMVRLQWEPLGMAVRLFQLRSTDCTHPEHFTLLAEQPPGTTQFTVQGLTSGLPYCYLARAVSRTGQEGGPSAVAGPFQVSVERPSAPNNLRLTP